MKINVKMKDAAVLRVAYQSEVASSLSKPVKKVKEYPTVSFDSRVVPGVGGLTLDSNCQLVLDVEVKGLREPSDWEIREGRYSEGDKIADFKVVSVGMVPRDYNSTEEASDAAAKRLKT